MRAALLLVALAACKSNPPPAASATPDAAVIRVVAPPDAGPPSHVVRLLDAFEREPDAGARTELAIELGREDAVAAGAQDRVIALVRAYQAIPNGDAIASSLLEALVKGDQPPPPAVGWLVLDLAAHGGAQTRFIAFYAVTKMTDRLDEVCAVMADLAPTQLAEAVTVVARTRDACVPHLDPVIDAIVRAAQHDAFEVEHFLATRALVEQTPLTPAQRARLAKAARQARKDAERHELEFANALVRALERPR